MDEETIGAVEMNKAPLSITFYYNTGETKIERLTKKYMLVNWKDEADIRRIMAELATDLNYVTGYGILEMVVTLDGRDLFVDCRSQCFPHDDANNIYNGGFSRMFKIE